MAQIGSTSHGLFKYIVFARIKDIDEAGGGWRYIVQFQIGVLGNPTTWRRTGGGGIK